MSKKYSRPSYNLVYILFSVVLGAFMGWMIFDFPAKGIAMGLFNNMGIWLTVSALLAYFSASSVSAAYHNAIYIAAVILTYYGRFMWIEGGYFTITMFYKLFFAVVGAVIGFIVWHARDNEWLGAICAAVPVSLLIAEAYPIIHFRTIPLIFDVVCAIGLFILLSKSKYQKLMSLPFVVIFVVALVYFNVLTKVFGGWI